MRLNVFFAAESEHRPLAAMIMAGTLAATVLRIRNCVPLYVQSYYSAASGMQLHLVMLLALLLISHPCICS